MDSKQLSVPIMQNIQNIGFLLSILKYSLNASDLFKFELHTYINNVYE